MKLKDLPKDTITSDILLLMPSEIFNTIAENIGLTTNHVYFSGRFSGPDGYWVRTPMDKDQIFPLSCRNPKEVLEWEVIED